MSFAVIVPGWDDDKCVSYQNMKKSPFARPSPGVRLVAGSPQPPFQKKRREGKSVVYFNINMVFVIMCDDKQGEGTMTPGALRLA